MIDLLATVCVHSQKIRKEKGEIISVIAESQVKLLFFQDNHNTSRMLP